MSHFLDICIKDLVEIEADLLSADNILNIILLTWEWDYSVDLYWMHRFSVGGNECQIVSLDGELSWAYGCEGVDHTESVSATWSDGEYFQWGVGHESSVGITELSFAVDQHRLGILTYGENDWLVIEKWWQVRGLSIYCHECIFFWT